MVLIILNLGMEEASGISQQEIDKLLSQKDVSTEIFLQKVMSLLKLPANATPDEIQSAWSNQLSDRISDISAILWHRLNPYVQILLQRKMQNTLHGQLVQIESISEPMIVMVEKYKKCFNAWIDSDKVSFNTNNLTALKQLSMKDYFILQFFITGTCTRQRGDDCLMIGITGRSTVGKSTLFESPLTEISHIYVNDKGVGRFKLENKPVLFFHDIDVRLFIFSKDRDLIKAICRSEASSVKVHSSTTFVPPVHIFYTSNTKLFNHKVKGASTFSSTIMSDISASSKYQEHINSIRCRFLECFCSEKPQIDPDWFPECGMFQRQHMILGLFDRVLKILSTYSGPESFYKRIQPHYILKALAKNANYYEHVFNTLIKDEIVKNVDKFIVKPEQKLDILTVLN